MSELPRPSGQHPVGRTTIECVDESRTDPYAENPNTPRALVLWVWYPTDARGDGEPAEYLPGVWASTGEFLGVDATGVHSNSIANAPLLADATRLPVLLLSPSGFPPLFLSALAEELASAGNVVVGINHTYETAVTEFPDGRVVSMNPNALAGALGGNTGDHRSVFADRGAVCLYKAADLKSVADHLERLQPTDIGLAADRLDFTRVAALGHSFGGNAALEWCRADPRCLAAVNLDGGLWSEVVHVGVPRPVMQILSQHPEFELTGDQAVAAGITQDPDWHDAERALAYEGWRKVQEVGRPARTVQIAGATHMSFMDLPFLQLAADSPARMMLGQTSIDPTRMWRITSDLVLAFFAEHRDGAPSTLDAAVAVPEITVGAP
jgi:pimeloyl-ACP methyl ester carboxylesterase